VPGTPFGRVLEVALLVRDALDELGTPSYVKTTGYRGVHVYVPIVRGPTQKQVWTFAKAFALAMELRHPRLVTAESVVAHRPAGRVFIGYEQNAPGRTVASVYSLRPTPRATVSAPVTWEEIELGFTVGDFRLDNMPDRLRQRGDLWAPLLARSGRVRLEDLR